jgi:hypothetical protein
MKLTNYKDRFLFPWVFALMAILICLSQSVYAETKLKLEEEEITGAHELPRVLYIVPWKKTNPASDPLPMHSLVDEALSPIDVDVFKRQVHYYDLTHTTPAAGKK